MLFTKAVISNAGKYLNEKYILMLKLDNHKNINFSNTCSSPKPKSISLLTE